MTERPRSSRRPSTRPRTRGWTTDAVVGWVLFALAVVGGCVLSLWGMFFGLVSDGCPSPEDLSAEQCSSGRIMTGVVVGVVSPWPPLVAALVLLVLGMRRRWVVSWVPLAAAAVAIGLWVLGGVVASSGVPD